MRAQRDRLREIGIAITDGTDVISTHGRIALEFGLRKAEMEMAWADWALDQLKR